MTPPGDREFLAIGTTSNEALHRELNNIFDNVHEMHRPVLELKLRILHCFKLLPHNSIHLGLGEFTASIPFTRASIH